MATCDEDTAFLRELLLVAEELNEQGFDTDRSEVFYAAYLALIHQNENVRTILSLQIAAEFAGDGKDTRRDRIIAGLNSFTASAKYRYLLPSTPKSRAILEAIRLSLKREEKPIVLSSSVPQDHVRLIGKHKRTK